MLKTCDVGDFTRGTVSPCDPLSSVVKVRTTVIAGDARDRGAFAHLDGSMTRVGMSSLAEAAKAGYVLPSINAWASTPKGEQP
jgi:hypothetical protein